MGLTLRTAPRGVRRLSRDEEWQADVEGVLPGDRLINVGSHELGSGTIGQIFDSMHGAPGEIRELVLERNGVRFTVVAPITAF